MSASRERPLEVLVAGGGVAAAEAVVALRALAGRRVRISLLTPEPELQPLQLSVAMPFGFGAPPPVPLSDLAERFDATLLDGALSEVVAETRTAVDEQGRRHLYDALLVAVGAHTRTTLTGALTFRGPVDAPQLSAELDKVARGAARRLVFAVPPGASWPLPLYELAVMAAVDLRSRGADHAEIAVVTPEPEPLALFGPAAGEAVRRLLAERGIALRTGVRPIAAGRYGLELSGGGVERADRVVSLPVAAGPAIPGLPADAAGFIPVDRFGRVAAAGSVYAAGDVTSFPIKQGGLATQQADAAATAIAAAAGARVTPEPFTPVLRGLLLTGGAPLYLRAQLDARGERAAADSAPLERMAGIVSPRALWWPPGKVAGRYLAPLLATARAPHLLEHPLEDLTGPLRSEDAGARDLALAVADHEAASGYLREAVQALDAAAALGGLPEGYAGKRSAWTAQLAGGRR